MAGLPITEVPETISPLNPFHLHFNSRELVGNAPGAWQLREEFQAVCPTAKVPKNSSINPFNPLYNHYNPTKLVGIDARSQELRQALWADFPTADVSKEEDINPFNPFYNHYDPNKLINGLHREVQAELEQRGLPHKHDRTLGLRLIEHNTKITLHGGFHEIQSRRLEAMETARLEAAAVRPADSCRFELFPRMPLEIRRMVWKLSLPGPRVVNVYRWTRSPSKLQFRSNDNLPNPAALSVCRESRSVALERYSLSFGSSNLYSDLVGGDTLYLGRFFRGRGTYEDSLTTLDSFFWIRFDSRLIGLPRIPNEISKALKADLRLVKRIALKTWTWRAYQRKDHQYTGNHLPYVPRQLWEDLKDFPNLEELLLVDGGSDGEESSYKNMCWLTPGYVVFEDKSEPAHDTPRSKTRIYREAKLVKDYIASRNAVVHGAESKGVRVRIVHANRIPTFAEYTYE